MSTKSGMVLIPHDTLEAWAASVMSLTEYDNQLALADAIRTVADSTASPRTLAKITLTKVFNVLEIGEAMRELHRDELLRYLAAAPASPPTPALDGWQPIETAPDRAIVANCSHGSTHWAELGVRGNGVMRLLWFTVHGKAIPTPTHWIPEPPK